MSSKGRERHGLKEAGVTDLTHAELEGAPLLLKLLSNLSSAHLAPNHPVLSRQLPFLLLHLLAELTRTL